VIDIARRYERADSEAAGTVLSSASQISNQAFAAGASVGAGLARAQTLPGALGSAARTPLMANLIEGVAASNPSTTILPSRTLRQRRWASAPRRSAQSARWARAAHQRAQLPDRRRVDVGWG